MNFGENKYAVHLHLESSMTGEGHDFVLLLVVVPMQTERERRDVVALNVMLRWLIA